MDVPLVDGDLPHYTAALLAAGSYDLILQKAAIRLHTYRGEVLSDASAGMDYLGWTGGKMTPAARRTILFLVIAEIEAIVGVKRAVLTESFDALARRLTVSGVVYFDDGEQRGVSIAAFGAGS